MTGAPLRLLLAGAALAFLGCQAAEEAASSAPPSAPRSAERRGIGLLPLEGVHAMKAPGDVTLDARRSLSVTDQVILARFSYEEVMTRLAEQSGVPGLTALRLHQEWWDSQRAAPGLGLGGPHCDDQRLPDGQPGFNGFPYSCSRAEGGQADEDPFVDVETNPGAYFPVGLFNRFDLAAEDGSDCGEYRIAFARRSGIADPRSRNLIMFEAVLPNPRPQLGLWGCRPVARFWAELSDEADPAVRAEALRRFYFDGLPGGFEPVIHVDNFGLGEGRPTGQVRTNQFMQFGWTLREFRLRRRCDGEACVVRFEPDTVKDNPTGLLFNARASHPLKEEFQQTAFPAQVASLGQADVLRFSMDLEDRFNSGQSNSTGTDNSYVFLLGSPATVNPLRTRLQQELTARGLALTPTQLVARAQALSCAGCHQLSNRADMGGGLTWPFKSLPFAFVHVNERALEEGPDGPRFPLSEAVTGTFLPHRQQVLEAFLDGRPPFCDPEDGPGPAEEGRPPRCRAARGADAR
jgi:hypothetical protein